MWYSPAVIEPHGSQHEPDSGHKDSYFIILSYLYGMKKLRITEKDYIKAVRRADRESEIERHDRPPARVQIHRSKRAYDRKKLKVTPIEELP